MTPFILPVSDDPDWVTVAVAARLYGRPAATFTQWCRKGLVPIRRLDGHPKRPFLMERAALERKVASAQRRHHRPSAV